MIQILKEEKRYQKLFTAGIINGIGDRFSQVALMTLILQMTGSGLSVGITLALRMLPFLIFGPISSIIATNISRKKLLIYTDFLRAFIAISFLWIDSASDMWIIYCGSFLLASGEALYSPTRTASIPSIVHAKNIKGINAWEQVSLGFVLILGAFTGGIVSFVFGLKAAFLVNIFSFIIAGFIIYSIPSLETVMEKEKNSETDTIKSIHLFKIITSSSLLMLLLSIDLIIPLVNGIENVLISVYAVQTFHVADLGVGILYSMLGVGFVISPLLTKWIKGYYLVFSFIFMMAQGIILLLVSQSQSFLNVVCLFGILTIFGGVSNTLVDTVVMTSVPVKYQGMYFGISATIANTSLGISMFFSGILLEFIQPRIMGAINGILYFSFGFIYLILHLSFYIFHSLKIQKQVK